MKTTINKVPASPKKERGNLKPTEIKPLVIAARKAYDFQVDLGNLDKTETFDTWRKAQCLEAVGKPGITACSHDHYRPLMAHFQILGGQDEKAFQNLTTTGPASKQTGDTHEARRILAHQITQAISAPDCPIKEGYVVFLVRQKTRRPDLKLTGEFTAALADRCTASQLTQIRNTVINRLNAKSGLGSPETRNRSATH